MIRRVIEAEPEFWSTLAGIHAASFERGWSAEDLRALAGTAHNRLYTMESAGVVASFIVLTVIAGEGEILTVATATDRRNQGLAGSLLKHVAETLAAESVEAIFLEVAVDNAAALALYDRAGFRPAGLRKAYYSRIGAPPVDACILRLALS